MSETSVGEGHCLCGAVKVYAATMSHKLGACHCEMCRRWGGGPFLALDCGSEVNFGGEENIQIYPSSDWAERGFCKICGSNLFYKVKGNNQYFMPAGIFSDLSEVLFDNQVFIDEKPEYYEFTSKTKNMTGAEVMAMYAPS